MTVYRVDRFGYPVPVTSGSRDGEGLSADQRRTLRNSEKLEAGQHPATGLAVLSPEWGYTCGDCVHLFDHRPGNRRFWKCDLTASRSAATDVRKSWPACARFRLEGAP